MVQWWWWFGCAFWRPLSAGACCRTCCVSCIQQCAKPCCITVCHAVINAMETAVMKARETILCIHGSAKQSVPGGGRGRSNKSDHPRRGMGKRQFGITSRGDQSITPVILFKCTNLNSFVAGWTLWGRIWCMLWACISWCMRIAAYRPHDWKSDQCASLCGPTIWHCVSL
jgi:hypothetical protein